MDAERLVLQAMAVLTRDFGAENVTKEHIYPLIPTAIKGLQEELLANNAPKLENFRVQHTVPITANKADLTTASEAGLRLDLLDRAKIYLAYSDAGKNPKLARFERSAQKFGVTSIQDRFYAIAYLEGKILNIRPIGADVHTNAVIQGITCPQTVSGLSTELEGDLVRVLAIIGTQYIKERRRNVDVSESKT